MVEQNKCLNCGAEVSSKFCQDCGQRTMIGRLTLKEIFTDFLSSVFNIDAPFPKTLSKMFFRSEEVIKDFIEGKRKTYYAPIKYMLLCLFLNILIGELIGFDPIENQRAIDNRELDETSKVGYQAGQFLSQYLNYFLFILPFSISVFSKLFFWKASYNFAERAAMGFYMAGQFIIISLIPIFLTKVNPALFHIMYPLAILYFTFDFYKMFATRSKILKAFLSFLTAFLSFFGYIMCAYLIALIIVTNFNS